MRASAPVGALFCYVGRSTPRSFCDSLQAFRQRAPIASSYCPDREATDQWLFLAQHVGLPTRLLDWSESGLVGLFFALLCENPVVWIIDPFELNGLSTGAFETEFPLTWHQPEGGPINIGAANIGGAWTNNASSIRLPVAVRPTNIHPRMSVQRSGFTVHGTDQRSLVELVPQLLTRIDIEPSASPQMLVTLHVMGINHSTVMPDLDGLAKELATLY